MTAPPAFTAALAHRLNGLGNLAVRRRKTTTGLPGCALIATGGKHLLLQRSGDNIMSRFARDRRGDDERSSQLPLRYVLRHTMPNANDQ
jgi:chemotaxis response regulator CheB